MLWVTQGRRVRTTVYVFAGGFDETLDSCSTAQNAISWAGIASSLENVLIANGSTATVNNRLYVRVGGAWMWTQLNAWSGGGSSGAAWTRATSGTAASGFLPGRCRAG